MVEALRDAQAEQGDMEPLEGIPFHHYAVGEPSIPTTKTKNKVIQGQQPNLPAFQQVDVSIEIKTSNSKKDGPIKHIMPHRNLAFLHHQALEFAKKCGIKNAALERVGYKEKDELVEVYDTLDMRLAMNKAGQFRIDKKIHFVIKVNSTSAKTD